MATVSEKMTAIADAIRDKTGETDSLTLDGMATGVNEAYDAGKKAQYDEFWDSLQYSGNRKQYIGTFSGRGWNDDVFRPKYDIVPTHAYMMFATDLADNYDGGVQDLVGCLEKAGVDLDFSQCKSLQMTWYQSIVTHIGIIDTRNASQLSQTFYSARRLHTIDKLILKDDGSQNLPYAPFSYCDALENIKIEGAIGVTVGIPQSPKLTYESLAGEYGIINALKDISSEGRTATLTLHANAKSKLSESDIATITQKGWTLA